MYKVLRYRPTEVIPTFFNVIRSIICDTSQKTAVLVHIVDINLMVFSKRNIFAFLKYIYFRPYMMPQLLWEQGRITIDWELYHEKAVKLKEYIYIVFTSSILL